MTKISVITPTKNRASTFLPDLVRSLENQVMPNNWQIEHVVCDDGSSPQEIKALHTLQKSAKIEIKIVSHASSLGPGASRNSATKASTGDFILDVDDDDLLPTNALEVRINHLEQTQSAWSFGNEIVVDEELRILHGKELVMRWNHAGMNQLELIQALLTNRAWFWAGTRTMRRDCLFSSSGFRSWDPAFIVAQDLDHWVRLVHEVGPPAHLNAFIVYWREKQNSHAINAVRSGLQKEMIDRIKTKWQKTIPELYLSANHAH